MSKYPESVYRYYLLMLGAHRAGEECPVVINATLEESVAAIVGINDASMANAAEATDCATTEQEGFVKSLPRNKADVEAMVTARLTVTELTAGEPAKVVSPELKLGNTKDIEQLAQDLFTAWRGGSAWAGATAVARESYRDQARQLLERYSMVSRQPTVTAPV
jgi:hypothetical protein